MPKSQIKDKNPTETKEHKRKIFEFHNMEKNLQAYKTKKKYYQKNQNHIKKNSTNVRFSLRILL